MRRTSSIPSAALLAAACLLAGGLSAPPPAAADEPSIEEQVDFGVKMARRGLWSEALFRFERASKRSPDDPEILNNMAVAYEATGRFDEALETYQRALRVAPTDREVRRNYARFVEFFQNFRPEAAEETAPAEGEEAPGDVGDRRD